MTVYEKLDMKQNVCYLSLNDRTVAQVLEEIFELVIVIFIHIHIDFVFRVQKATQITIEPFKYSAFFL